MLRSVVTDEMLEKGIKWVELGSCTIDDIGEDNIVPIDVDLHKYKEIHIELKIATSYTSSTTSVYLMGKLGALSNALIGGIVPTQAQGVRSVVVNLAFDGDNLITTYGRFASGDTLAAAINGPQVAGWFNLNESLGHIFNVMKVPEATRFDVKIKAR